MLIGEVELRLEPEHLGFLLARHLFQKFQSCFYSSTLIFNLMYLAHKSPKIIYSSEQIYTKQFIKGAIRLSTVIILTLGLVVLGI